MEYLKIDCGAIPAEARISSFKGARGTGEFYISVCPNRCDTFENQLQWISKAYQAALDSVHLDISSAVLRRFFCGDSVNQAAALESQDFSNPAGTQDICAVSCVGQSPLPPAKIALWAYHIGVPHCKLNKSRQGQSIAIKREKLCHYWSTGLACPGENSYAQTQAVFQNYNAFLNESRMTLADNVMRTWLFVRDVDVNYKGMVAARREFFEQHGLTAATHFIASTGVEGNAKDTSTRVLMDVYAISGLVPGQVRFLSAPSHLCPTHNYGVTFERGTAISYADRRHAIISGTASIDNNGKILHEHDVLRQLDRALENFEALLSSAGAGLGDVTGFLVYVRNFADQALVQEKLRERFENLPMIVVHAPVCRPGWLVELEGIAITAASNPDMPAF